MTGTKMEVKTICPHCKKLYDTADDARNCAQRRN